MENASPTFSSFPFAPVRMRVGVVPARESCAVSAIVKHPAWAAPISSSGLVADWPSSNRDLNEYGPSKAPLPTFSRPLPSAKFPFHSASAFRVGIKPPFNLLCGFNLAGCYFGLGARYCVPAVASFLVVQENGHMLREKFWILEQESLSRVGIKNQLRIFQILKEDT